MKSIRGSRANQFWRASVLGLCVAVFGWTQAGATQQVPTNYKIGARDVLNITVYEQPDISGKYTVEDDGSFSFWQIGRVTAKGLTIRQFEQELVARLKNGYFRDPHVSVSIDQYKSQRIVVLGEVRTPGTHTLNGDMSLIEALAVSGGTLPSAAGDVRVVRRPVEKGLPGSAPSDEVFVININDLQRGSAQLLLLDGDTILVPRAESVYVFGEIKNPGAYAIQQNTTVLQALSLAGGVTPNGSLSRIKIVRLEKGQKKEFKVKIGDPVHPGDTIIVGERIF